MNPAHADDDRRYFDVDRGGKWRQTHDAPDVSKRDLKIGTDLIHFIAWQQEVGGNVMANARSWALDHKYTREQNDQFRAVLDVYLRKWAPKRRESLT